MRLESMGVGSASRSREEKGKIHGCTLHSWVTQSVLSAGYNRLLKPGKSTLNQSKTSTLGMGVVIVAVDYGGKVQPPE